MTDRIQLTGIRVMARHGVLPLEQSDLQPFEVDVSVFLDLQPAGSSDDLADTVDYGGLGTRIHDLVAGESHALIETVAEKVASEILSDDRIQRAVVTVHKPAAPIPVSFQDVSVTIDRSR